MKSLIKQRGTAIIVALFVVSLVAIAATIMIERTHIDIHRSELILNNNQANLYAEGAIAWAKDQLSNDWKFQQKNQLIDKTPIVMPEKKMNGAVITSTIYDMQGYFNINNLTDQKYQNNFLRLLQAVSPKINMDTAKAITSTTMDWISSTARNITLEEYYAKLKPSYRAPHRPMVNASELRLVKGMTPELFNALLPYITALPPPTTVNINNAAAPVLMSLSQTMSPDAAKAIITYRQTSPFATMQSFLNFDIVKNNPIEENKITVTSEYFLVETHVTIGQQQTTIYTALQRATKEKEPKVIVLWQSMGTL